MIFVVQLQNKERTELIGRISLFCWLGSSVCTTLVEVCDFCVVDSLLVPCFEALHEMFTESLLQCFSLESLEDSQHQ